jgi:hypothetical protein
MEVTMKSRLILAACLLSMVGACVARQGAAPGDYNIGYDRNNGYYDSTYYRTVTTMTASRL